MIQSWMEICLASDSKRNKSLMPKLLYKEDPLCIRTMIAIFFIVIFPHQKNASIIFSLLFQQFDV